MRVRVEAAAVGRGALEPKVYDVEASDLAEVVYRIASDLRAKGTKVAVIGCDQEPCLYAILVIDEPGSAAIVVISREAP